MSDLLPRGSRLEIGCGTLPREEADWWHLDLDAHPHVELVGDAAAILSSLPDGWLGEIYASHFLEHNTGDEVSTTLNLWFAKLAPGGTLEVHVPNLPTTFSAFLAADTVEAKRALLTELFWPGHKWGFDRAVLAAALESAGFRDLEPAPARVEVHDNPSNLGLRARKPG
jgi:predicted SAM-dependent methyltransferase